MTLNIYNRVVNRHRDYKYRGYLAKREHKAQSGGRSGWIIPVTPSAIYGYGMGKQVGNRMGMLSRISDSWLERLFIVFHGPILYFTVVVLCMILFVPLPFLPDSVGGGLPFLCGAVPIVHAHYRARKDLKTTTRLRNTTQPTAPDALAVAYANLDHRQQPARHAAFGVLQQAFTDSPGKAVKHLSREPDEIGDTLVSFLDAGDPTIVESCVICLKWLSRDFGAVLQPHAETFLEYLSSDSSVLQANAAIALGNIGATDPERMDQYAKVLQSAVTDPDADVRKAAVVALRNLPCKRSAKLLKHLADDVDPEVQQEATTAFKQVLTALKSSSASSHS